MTGEADKAAWRARLLAARASLSPSDLAAAASVLRRHLLGRLDGVGRVAAYVPVGREPGSLDLLDALWGAGIEVLLPVVTGGGLDWSAYRGRDRLRPGALGTREPDGSRLGPTALAKAGAVLVPALAVDHRGNRLGRGGGYFDRALAVVPAGVAVAALLHDGELVRHLPADPWDRRVGAAVTPAGGWTRLPVVEHHGH
ncbi:MAG TPA: 5-formyltetrahydrofolate cyclo-ligase [Mycobacteriales bacterium]|nr:5-formyltetrahydrofolate cyclo-ligase [Mycobacteriales bacterium]